MVDRFVSAGGKVVVIPPDTELQLHEVDWLKAEWARIRNLLRSDDDDFRLSQLEPTLRLAHDGSRYFIGLALDGEGHIVGAIGWLNRVPYDSEAAFLAGIASTGEMPGTGAALMASMACRVAPGRRIRTSNLAYSALKFYRRLGVDIDRKCWEPAQVAAFLSTQPDVPLGLLPGYAPTPDQARWPLSPAEERAAAGQPRWDVEVVISGLAVPRVSDWLTGEALSTLREPMGNDAVRLRLEVPAISAEHALGLLNAALDHYLRWDDVHPEYRERYAWADEVRRATSMNVLGETRVRQVALESASL